MAIPFPRDNSKWFFWIFLLILLSLIKPRLAPFLVLLLLLSFLFRHLSPWLQQFKGRVRGKVIEGEIQEEKPYSNNFKNFFKLENMTRNIIFGVILAILLVILIKSIVVIQAGTTGVYHLFGKVRDQEVSSGIHLINPLARITKFSIRTEEYTMSMARGEGKKYQADAISTLTKEGLNVDLDITVFYHIIEEYASEIYTKVGATYEEKIIRPEIRSMIREVVAQYKAEDIYSEKRQEVALNILGGLKEKLASRGIEAEDVLLRNVQLPEKLAEAIQEKLTAEQEAQRYDFVLQREEKEAERKRIEARGQRDAQTIINESLTTRYLNYLYIQSLKEREGTIYVPVNPESGLPLFKEITP